MVDADSFPLADRIYVLLDSQSVIKVNNHAITWASYPRVIKYVMTNPDQKEGLPANIQDAIICTNIVFWQPTEGSEEEVQFRKQYLLHWLSRVYYDEIQTLVGDDWGVNWERMDTLALGSITTLLSPQLAIPSDPEEDRVLLKKLPPWTEEEPDVTQLKARNVYSVIVNAKGDILVRAQLTDLEDLREMTKTFILNPAAREDLAESPQKAIISLKNDRGTPYDRYLAVYNELKAAYEEIWEETAQRRFGQSFADLSTEEQRAIKRDIPFVISETEPTDFGEE
jgi:biopolymer transport protein ExbD